MWKGWQRHSARRAGLAPLAQVDDCPHALVRRWLGPFRLLLELSAAKRLNLRVSALLACLLLGGCSLSTPQKPTEPSGITQQLLIRSLERALAQLDIERLKSRSVAVEVFSPLQAGPEAFVREFVISWLRIHGVRT